MSKSHNIRFVFFGTPLFAVDVLEALKERGLLPSLIVTRPDKPQGRGQKTLPSPAKIWAEVHGIPVYDPVSLKDEEVLKRLKEEDAQVFVVAAYGLLIPKDIYCLPPGETLNIHPSLLPKLRGPSPVQSTILLGEKPGVSIMKITEGMDEGPVLAQEEVVLPEGGAPKERLLEEMLAKKGAEMLADVLPDWIEGSIKPAEQSEAGATYCKKISKEMGQIDLAGDPEENWRKVRALAENPGTYTMFERKDGKQVRVKILDAELTGGKFAPTRVIPEGKREMEWQDFLHGNS